MLVDLQQQVHIKVHNIVYVLSKKYSATVLNYAWVYNSHRVLNIVKEKMLDSDNGKNCEKYLHTRYMSKLKKCNFVPMIKTINP